MVGEIFLLSVAFSASLCSWLLIRPENCGTPGFGNNQLFSLAKALRQLVCNGKQPLSNLNISHVSPSAQGFSSSTCTLSLVHRVVFVS